MANKTISKKRDSKKKVVKRKIHKKKIVKKRIVKKKVLPIPAKKSIPPAKKVVSVKTPATKPVLKVPAKKIIPPAKKVIPAVRKIVPTKVPVKVPVPNKKIVPVKTVPLKKGQKRIALPKKGEAFNISPPPLKIKEEERIRITIKSIQDILKMVGTKSLFEIYKSLKTVDPNYFTRGFTGTFESKKEVSDFFKERIGDFFKGRYDDIRSSISEFRKGGEEVGSLDLKSLRIPLKMKVLNQHFNLKEFNSLLSIVKFLEASLKIIRDIRDKKAEEEKIRDRALQKKKVATQTKPVTKSVAKSPTKTVPTKVVKKAAPEPAAKLIRKKPVVPSKTVPTKVVKKVITKKTILKKV